jgi:hypothetical protein
MAKSAKNVRQFVTAQVHVGHESRKVRFMDNGKAVRVSSRGLPLLRLRRDVDREQVIIRARVDGHQQTLRLADIPLDRAFAKAVKQFWI